MGNKQHPSQNSLPKKKEFFRKKSETSEIEDKIDRSFSIKLFPDESTSNEMMKEDRRTTRKKFHGKGGTLIINTTISKGEEEEELDIFDYIKKTPWVFKDNENTIFEPTEQMIDASNWEALRRFELNHLFEDRVDSHQREFISKYQNLNDEEREVEKLRLMKSVFDLKIT
ncbi:hypothetical protein LZF95_19560 [Algoriphagus sp. AGSA1]|uniref:hypothetical protein n=1 Tax=Algoriphagus sp. AGSA1 TaxID=2907213 RepID=UPI001F271AE4|nr:hypothetical protein [Algoriphagus sp. AGSA1]MCE7056886.1 hypothetical protein [Algoriphagus sp. AGSA1]